jgi:hypothetical protein
MYASIAPCPSISIELIVSIELTFLLRVAVATCLH